MTYTFDRSSPTDFTLETRVGSGDDVTTLFAANGTDVIGTVAMNGHRFIRYAPANWGVTSGTSSDTLVATDDNDVIFWDLGTTDGFTTGGSSGRVSDTTTRARLYTSSDSDNLDFEVFSLKNGNDVLNLTYNEAGTDPGGYASNATVYGGGGNDTLALSTGADRVYGGSGSDVIFGGGGLDRLWGDDGSTDIDASSGSADTIYSSEGANATLWGEGGNDVLTGSGEGIETFYGGAGNDTIDNYSGFGDVAYGASGDDRIITADTAYGGTGNDWIDGGYGGTGEEGRDSIWGEEGNDTLFGYDADDKLYGGVGYDTLFGGTENDQLYFSNDATTSGSVRLWTGVASEASFSLGLSSHSYSFDTFFGDDGTDTLLLDDGDNVFVNSPGDLNTGSGYGVGGVNRMVGIEIVMAGAGADIVSLNHKDTGPNDTDSLYASNVTIVGEDGNDVLVSGSGADLLIGGRLNNGVSNGADTIFGGGGNDVIYGDSRTSLGGSEGSGNDILYGGAGNDTIYGGDGDDTIYGGPGDDFAYGGVGDDIIFDDGSANGFMSADGSDLLVLNLNNAALNKGASVTGVDGLGDGNDRVFVTGSYASVSFSLGGADDVFISRADSGTGTKVDRVMGQSGNDAISTWQGNDYVDGGSGADVLWGGAGGDTIYGGAEGDFLYGGTGDNDQIYGGGGYDYYYWARYDGQGDQIYDDFRGTNVAGQSENALLVFAGFDEMGELPVGTGVFEVDGVLTDNVGGNDMVRAYDLDGAGSGTLWRLEVLQGSGAGNYVDFDQRDISAIGLWNHDATGTTPVITAYVWDGTTYSLV